MAGLKQNAGICSAFPGLLGSWEDVLLSIRAEHTQA